MTVRELAELFMRTDPKQNVLVFENDVEIFDNRIEWLFNCDNPLEERQVDTLTVNDYNYSSAVLEIRIK